MMLYIVLRNCLLLVVLVSVIQHREIVSCAKSAIKYLLLHAEESWLTTIFVLSESQH